MLDDRDFEGWLECYTPDSEFWMPAWDDDDTLTTDPQSEVSLIYYRNRAGLEDRVFRIRTDRSSATSLPDRAPATTSPTWRSSSQDDDAVEVRFNWFTLYFRYDTVDTYFGTSFYTLDLSGGRAADQEEESRPQERLHPPRHRHLSRLSAGSRRHELSNRSEFEDGVTRFIECAPTRLLPTHPTARGSTSRSTAATAPAAPASASASPGSTSWATTSREALTEDEASEGYVLTCQMRPDIRLRASDPHHVGRGEGGPVSALHRCDRAIDRLSDTSTAFTIRSTIVPPSVFCRAST